MKTGDVCAGSCYVSERVNLIREVVEEVGVGRVRWRAYDLDSGKPTGESRLCSQESMLQWADREATPEKSPDCSADGSLPGSRTFLPTSSAMR